MDYYLVTPVYNEEDNINQLIETVITQTVTPEKWIIVNNGSSDNTVKIIEEIIINKNINFIHIVNQQRIENVGGNINFNMAVNYGFSCAMSNTHVGVDFIGKIDADVLLPPDFFQTLLEILIENKQIGVISAINYVHRGNNPQKYSEDLLFQCDEITNSRSSISDIRLYRINAIVDIGGMPTAKYAPDSMTLLLLGDSGWGIMKTGKTHFVTTRDAFCSIPTFANMVKTGETNYYYGYPVISLLFKTFILILQNKKYAPFGLIVGYFQSFIRKEARVSSEIVTIVRKQKGLASLIINYINRQ
ncbi:MAG: glycosyltransferase family 2 protein [Eubacteriales bacterium]